MKSPKIGDSVLFDTRPNERELYYVRQARVLAMNDDGSLTLEVESPDGSRTVEDGVQPVAPKSGGWTWPE